MRYRPDVWLGHNADHQQVILGALRDVERDYVIAFTISGGCEGKHSAKSKHWLGHAIDCFYNGWADGKQEFVAKLIRQRLPVGYDVVVEPSHFHIEYDPKISEISVEWAG